MTTEEFDVITVLRERVKELEDLLRVAAALINKADNPKNFKEVFPARELFIIECERYGVIERGKYGH